MFIIWETGFTYSKNFQCYELILTKNLPFSVSCNKSPRHGGWRSNIWPSNARSQCVSAITLSYGLIDAFFFASFGNLAVRAASPRKADQSSIFQYTVAYFTLYLTFPQTVFKHRDRTISNNQLPVAAAAVRVIKSPGVWISTADLTVAATRSRSAPANSAISTQYDAKSCVAEARATSILERQPPRGSSVAATAATAEANPAMDSAECTRAFSARARSFFLTETFALPCCFWCNHFPIAPILRQFPETTVFPPCHRTKNT